MNFSLYAAEAEAEVPGTNAAAFAVWIKEKYLEIFALRRKLIAKEVILRMKSNKSDWESKLLAELATHGERFKAYESWEIALKHLYETAQRDSSQAYTDFKIFCAQRKKSEEKMRDDVEWTCVHCDFSIQQVQVPRDRCTIM